MEHAGHALLGLALVEGIHHGHHVGMRGAMDEQQAILPDVEPGIQHRTVGLIFMNVRQVFTQHPSEGDEPQQAHHNFAENLVVRVAQADVCPFVGDDAGFVHIGRCQQYPVQPAARTSQIVVYQHATIVHPLHLDGTTLTDGAHRTHDGQQIAQGEKHYTYYI